MTTLAAFKRATKAGDRIEAVHTDHHGNRVSRVYHVTHVTAGNIYYQCGDWVGGKASLLLPWPAASDVTAITDDEITYRQRADCRYSRRDVVGDQTLRRIP